MFEDIKKTVSGKMSDITSKGGVDALKGYLAGVSFPLEKAQLIGLLSNKGVPSAITDLVDKLPEKMQFDGADQVIDEARKVLH